MTEQLLEAAYQAMQNDRTELARVYLGCLRQIKHDNAAPIDVCILTSIVNKSQGDVSAATKLMTELKAIPDVNINLTWIVRRDVIDYPIQHDYPEDVNLIEILSEYSWLEDKLSMSYGFYELRDQNHTYGQQALKALLDSDVVISCPTTHLLSRADITLLEQLQLPLTSMTEYNSMQERFLNLITGINRLGRRYTPFLTGLGPQHVGVYIPDVSSRLDTLEQDCDPALQQFLDPESTLYFSYMTVTRASFVVPQSIVTDLDYITMCILDAIAKNKTAVDIVINLPEAKQNELLPHLRKKLSRANYRRVHKILFYRKHEDDLQEAQHFTNQRIDRSQPTLDIRIINPYPMKNKTMIALMNQAEPIVTATGDQSFFEELLSGKLVIYQLLAWKVNLFKNIIALCEQEFGKDSPLYTFYNLQYQSGISLHSNMYYLERVLEVYHAHEEQLLEEAQQLATHIKENYDLVSFINTDLRDYILESRQSQLEHSSYHSMLRTLEAEPNITTQDVDQLLTTHRRAIRLIIRESLILHREDATVDSIIEAIQLILPDTVSIDELKACNALRDYIQARINWAQRSLGSRHESAYTLINAFLWCYDALKEGLFRVGLWLMNRFSRSFHCTTGAPVIEPQVVTEYQAEDEPVVTPSTQPNYAQAGRPTASCQPAL